MTYNCTKNATLNILGMRHIVLLLLLLLLFPIGIFAQAPRQHDPTIFTDSTGQVFVRADQPAFMFISPAEKPDELVPVPSSDKDANPMYWDGNGVHYIAHRDLKLNKTIRFRIMADGFPPSTKLKFDSGVIFSIDSSFYVEKDATVKVHATDNMTGVSETLFSLNGLPYIPFAEGVTFNSSGDNIIRVYSVDRVGNVEKPKEFKVIVSDDAVVRMQNIYFGLNSSKLRNESIVEVDKLVKLLRDYPNVKMHLTAHTDSRGESKYNMQLSEARAQAVVDYIVGKGIPKNRISSKGYGDTKPVNECAKGVECTEAQHKLNRRVEFSISKISE